jgi:hypothetical protein
MKDRSAEYPLRVEKWLEKAQKWIRLPLYGSSAPVLVEFLQGARKRMNTRQYRIVDQSGQVIWPEEKAA